MRLFSPESQAVSTSIHNVNFLMDIGIERFKKSFYTRSIPSPSRSGTRTSSLACTRCHHRGTDSLPRSGRLSLSPTSIPSSPLPIPFKLGSSRSYECLADDDACIIGQPSAGGGRIPTALPPLSLRWFHRPRYMLNLEIIDLEAGGHRSWRGS